MHLFTRLLPDSDLPRPSGANASQEEELHYRLAIINRKLLPAYRISLILSTIIYTLVFLLGCTAVEKCPASTYIPLYLVIAGVLGMIMRLLNFIRSFIKMDKLIRKIEWFLQDVEGIFFIMAGINAADVVIYGIFGSMFIIGWVNLNNCPLNIMIPIYLIVAGFTGSVMKALSTTRNKHVFNIFLVVVLLYSVWTILGSYWVYREYQPNYYNDENRNYCNRTAYLQAFWILTVQYGVLCLFVTLAGCYYLMRGDFKR